MISHFGIRFEGQAHQSCRILPRDLSAAALLNLCNFWQSRRGRPVKCEASSISLLIKGMLNEKTASGLSG